MLKLVRFLGQCDDFFLTTSERGFMLLGEMWGTFQEVCNVVSLKHLPLNEVGEALRGELRATSSWQEWERENRAVLSQLSVPGYTPQLEDSGGPGDEDVLGIVWFDDVCTETSAKQLVEQLGKHDIQVREVTDRGSLDAGYAMWDEIVG